MAEKTRANPAFAAVLPAAFIIHQCHDPLLTNMYESRPTADTSVSLCGFFLMFTALTNRRRFVKMSANSRASSAFAAAFLAASYILKAKLKRSPVHWTGPLHYTDECDTLKMIL